jgi:Tfp pilus assembly protein PilW
MTWFERLRVRLFDGRDDSGMTLVELLVAMVTTSVVLGVFLLSFTDLNNSATNATGFSQQQGQVRDAMRIMESDIRSSDPLLLVPSSFTLDSNGSSNVGTNGTSATDIIAMYSTDDVFSPCFTGPTPGEISPFQTTPPAANLIWAYDPVAKTLTRYSYCSGAWTADYKLSNLANAAKTMFQASQQPGATLQTQTATPSPTTVTNQGAPVCGVNLTVSISAKIKGNTSPFKTHVTIELQNQGSFSGEGCG